MLQICFGLGLRVRSWAGVLCPRRASLPPDCRGAAAAASAAAAATAATPDNDDYADDVADDNAAADCYPTV